MYSYHADDRSVLSRVLTPYWYWVARRTPTYISPNVITCFGVSIIIVSSTTIFCGSAHSESIIPWAFHSLSLFLYQTTDAVDGIHARRLNASSALGEFLDHSSDGVAGIITVLTTLLTLHVPPHSRLLGCWLYAWAYALVHLRHYITGILTHYMVDGASEGVMICVLIHLLTAAQGGRALWLVKIGGLTLGEVVFHVYVLCSLVHILYSSILLYRLPSRCFAGKLLAPLCGTLFHIILFAYVFPTLPTKYPSFIGLFSSLSIIIPAAQFIGLRTVPHVRSTGEIIPIFLLCITSFFGCWVSTMFSTPYQRVIG